MLFLKFMLWSISHTYQETPVGLWGHQDEWEMSSAFIEKNHLSPGKSQWGKKWIGVRSYKFVSMPQCVSAAWI